MILCATADNDDDAFTSETKGYAAALLGRLSAASQSRRTNCSQMYHTSIGKAKVPAASRSSIVLPMDLVATPPSNATPDPVDLKKMQHKTTRWVKALGTASDNKEASRLFEVIR